MVREIAAETRQRLGQAKSRPLGVRRILRQDPHARPRRLARSPAPSSSRRTGSVVVGISVFDKGSVLFVWPVRGGQ
jgi:hypothetical protein